MLISSSDFINKLTERGVGPYLGVPCSFLKPFINYVIDRDDLVYVAATNEGEAVAIASGAYLAGQRPVVMFQNSGLGNAVSPLASLNHVFHIPLLLITTWRGEPGLQDAPQHKLMGEITDELFDVLCVKHDYFPATVAEIDHKLAQAEAHMHQTGLPYAFIMRKGTVDAYPLQRKPPQVKLALGQLMPAEPKPAAYLQRHEAVALVADVFGERALIIATTGKTGRELYAYRDRATHFYMIGSMGCAASLGLGVALHRLRTPTVVLDGDGAVLMRMESLASIGRQKPPNLIHIVLDNEAYDSTGGQQSISGSVSFPEVAVACGYATGATLTTAAGLTAAMETALITPGPHLLHVKIRMGSAPNVGRPTLTPPEYASRFREAALALE